MDSESLCPNDLHVLAHQSIKTNVQMQQVKRANNLLIFIARGFQCRSKGIVLYPYLYCALAYCVQFWPHEKRTYKHRGSTVTIHQTDPGTS